MNYGNKSNNRRVYQPKTSITNQIITEQEKLAAETALRSLKQKMANKEKKPIRQTNTANQGRRMQNYNNVNMKGNNYIHMSNTPNYNNMKYNYPSNVTEINKNKGYYSNMNQKPNNKPITANEYRNNHHNYNPNHNIDLNDNDIYMNPNNYQKRNYNQNQYNMNQRSNNYKNPNSGNNYYSNYSKSINNNNYSNNSNYTNNYQIGKPKRISNASAIPNKNNLNINNYNNYNPKYSSQEDDENDLRPIGGGLTADEVPNISLPTSPCPHCGRSFNSNALTKHVKICEKVFLKKRKAFNAQKYRFVDSEQASLMKQGVMKEKKNPLLNKKNNGQIPKWKLQSMAFRAICHPEKNSKPNNMKGGNKMNNNMMGNNGYNNMGGGMNYDAIAYGYKHCELCNRNYNEEAYNKHLNFCKRRYENEKLKGKNKKVSSNNSGIKNQYSKGIYGSVKYNNNVKYNKKK